MKLNLPILEQLSGSQNILIAGMGGGFDVFCGLPLYFELQALDYDVHLASFSFSDIIGLYEGEQLTDTLVGVSTEIEGIFDYFPEYFLSEWFYDTHNDDVIIWSFEKAGARPLTKNYKVLVDHLDIDCIILVDGGVDSLMRGDEPEPGTMFEDSLSLLAVSDLSNVKTKIVACLGLGIEYEIGYAHLFENIAQLSADKILLGTCSLTQRMTSYKQFRDAVLYVFEQQPDYPSVICSSVISAVDGHYGDYHLTKRTHGSTLRISPLMSMYWFFELKGVAKHNQILSQLRLTYSVDDAWKKFDTARKNIDLRPTPDYPLP